LDAEPVSRGKTDTERMQHQELIYTGVRRTPLCSLMGWSGAAEFFATTLDVYLLRGQIPEDPNDCDTADGRPATKAHAHSRIARMLCSDGTLMPSEQTHEIALGLAQAQETKIRDAIERVWLDSDFSRFGDGGTRVVAAGSGEFLARAAIDRVERLRPRDGISLSDTLGPELSTVAPAYAVARLAAERSR
jgi:hypothetical protein